MNNPLIINLFPSTLSREKIIFLFILLLILTLNGCKTVNYSDTNLMKLCREHIAHGWKSYVKINRKEFNSKGYFVTILGEDGRCEHGIGPTQQNGFLNAISGRPIITSLELVNFMLEEKK